MGPPLKLNNLTVWSFELEIRPNFTLIGVDPAFRLIKYKTRFEIKYFACNEFGGATPVRVKFGRVSMLFGGTHLEQLGF